MSTFLVILDDEPGDLESELGVDDRVVFDSEDDDDDDDPSPLLVPSWRPKISGACHPTVPLALVEKLDRSCVSFLASPMSEILIWVELGPPTRIF
jgi:hypothetical protein